MDRRIDLDAARAARREQKGAEPIVVVFGGQEFTMPAEAPFDMAERLGEFAALGIPADDDGKVDTAKVKAETLSQAVNAVTAAMRSLLGDQWHEFARQQPTLDDMIELVRQIMPLYSTSAGEAQASAVSS